jgi:hypothetical protein
MLSSGEWHRSHHGTTTYNTFLSYLPWFFLERSITHTVKLYISRYETRGVRIWRKLMNFPTTFICISLKSEAYACPHLAIYSLHMTSEMKAQGVILSELHRVHYLWIQRIHREQRNLHRQPNSNILPNCWQRSWSDWSTEQLVGKNIRIGLSVCVNTAIVYGSSSIGLHIWHILNLDGSSIVMYWPTIID